MLHPWQEIDLDIYEKHMSLQDIMQLQTLNGIMYDQLYDYNVNTVMILGIAGGNGLNHIKPDDFKTVYGVDINHTYLQACQSRYPHFKNVFVPIEADITSDKLQLPQAELLIADLFVEYVGYTHMKASITKVKPDYTSFIIQVPTEDNFVSDSPYLHAFDRLSEIYHTITLRQWSVRI